jgi:c-di-GMP-binding flagellar brake protein YcgR
MERRKHPRVEKILPIKAFGETFDFVTETMNIGAGGVLCHLERPIPVATKLRMVLLLPSLDSPKPFKIDCEGIVVRVQENLNLTGKDRYYIAIMFSDIRPEDKAKIIQLVNAHLTDKG